jgi:hypothetical protein
MACADMQVGSISEMIQATCSIALFGASCIGVRYACKTLGSIDKQNQAFIASERAWLKIEPVDGKFSPGHASPVWKITNVGKSPAVLIETQAVFELRKGYEEYEHTPDYGKPIVLNRRLLAPQDSMSFSAIWSINDNGKRTVVTPNSRTNLINVRTFGYVKYINGFGQEAVAKFCYIRKDADYGELSLKFGADFTPNLPLSYVENT